jgi:hypothetical protein
MEPRPLVALVVDQDKVRGRQLVHQLEELSDVRASLATELGDAVIAMQEQHPPFVLVSEELGTGAAELLQRSDPEAFVVVVHNRAA